MSDTSPEVLEAFRYTNERGEASLVVWCRHCARWHWHGAGRSPGAGDGHRVAHCGDDQSPYTRIGYTLQEVGTITARDMRQRRLRQKGRR